MAKAKRCDLPSWSEMFANGRTIFYEGGDPKGFRAHIKERFGFDVAKCPGQGFWGGGGWNKRDGYRFHCPAEHLDEIYGSLKYPMGS